MQHGQHALVENSDYANAVRTQSIEDDVLALLVAKQVGSNLVARAAAPWILSKLLTAGFELAQIAGALLEAPGGDGVRCDAVEVGFGSLRKMVLGHGSAQGRKAVFRTDPIEDSGFGVGASVTFVNRGAELAILASYRRCSRSSAATPTRTTSSMLVARPATTCASARRTTSFGRSMWLMRTPSKLPKIVAERPLSNNQATELEGGGLRRKGPRTSL